LCRSGQEGSRPELHEESHRSIVALHESRCIPYIYAEMVSLVTQLFADK